MRTIAISGGFDPIHVGHLDLIEAAAKHGRVMVILNSDAWLIRKKGYAFMRWEDRRRLLLAMKSVHSVVSVDDADGTVCKALVQFKPDYFANGGDRTSENTPELNVCCDYMIRPLFGIGGGKVESSSKLVERVA